MANSGKHKRKAHAEQSDTAKEIRGVGSRIAPAVALLLLGDKSFAQIPDGTDVSEPSTLGLLAAGGAVAGLAAYVRRKYRK